MKLPEIKYGKTKASIVNEFLKTDAKIKTDNIKEPEKLIKQYKDLMYKCFDIVANEIDDFISDLGKVCNPVNKTDKPKSTSDKT